VMCLIKLHCSMQICLLPKSKDVGGSWWSSQHFKAKSRTDPTSFCSKNWGKKHTHTHTKTVSCKVMDSTDDAVFCICEVLKGSSK
jgi:hypothetical protein